MAPVKEWTASEVVDFLSDKRFDTNHLQSFMGKY